MYIVGDIHGEFGQFADTIKDLNELIIQVGDFGIYPNFEKKYHTAGITKTVWFIDGNHDYTLMLPVDVDKPKYFEEGLWFAPRGYVTTIEGKKVLFLGGSKSVDYKFRHCLKEEQLTKNQANRAVKNAIDVGGIDLMITHTPPDYIMRKYLPPEQLRYSFNLDPDTWIDESALLIQEVWEKLKYPRLICGHLHKSIKDDTVQVLDGHEVLKI